MVEGQEQSFSGMMVVKLGLLSNQVDAFRPILITPITSALIISTEPS